MVSLEMTDGSFYTHQHFQGVYVFNNQLVYGVAQGHLQPKYQMGRARSTQSGSEMRYQ